MSKRAFLVIVEYDPDAPVGEPWIGDLQWTLKQYFDKGTTGWKFHTTEATAEMLKHHGVPYQDDPE